MTVPILILAGGASSRMGSRDKLLEPVDGQPLLRLQAWRALKASRNVTVLTRPGRPDLQRALAGLQVRVIAPTEAQEGIGGSIRRGTRTHLRSKCFLLVLADLVELEAQDLRSVINARSTDANIKIWRGATSDGKPGHPVLFEHHVYADLLNLRGDTGAKAVMEKHADHLRLIPLPGDRARLDLDTPEAWDSWRAKRADPQSQ